MSTSQTAKLSLSTKRAQTAKNILLEEKKCRTCKEPAQVTTFDDGIALAFCIPHFHDYLQNREINRLLESLGYAL